MLFSNNFLSKKGFTGVSRYKNQVKQSADSNFITGSSNGSQQALSSDKSKDVTMTLQEMPSTAACNNQLQSKATNVSNN